MQDQQKKGAGQSPASNSVVNSNRHESACSCRNRSSGRAKAAYPSQSAAEAWYAQKSKVNGWTDSQRAYECPQVSGVWHLTSDMEPRLTPVTQASYDNSKTKPLAITEKIRQYRAAHPGARPREIAEAVGCKPQNVYGEIKSAKKAGRVESEQSCNLSSLASIEARKKELAAEMAKLEAAEKKAREELMPTVTVYGNAGALEVRIVTDRKPYVLPLEYAAVLKTRLVVALESYESLGKEQQ